MDDRLNIEGFELLEVIGRGGMGTVYKARQKRPDRFVALKVIHGHYAADPEFRARFQAEIRVAVELEHQNLVPLFDAGDSNGNLYMAFRLVRGRDLKEILEADGPMAPERAVGIIGQLSAALEYVHECGILHRDVKPSNLILDEGNDHLYLSDFGIAKAKDATHALTAKSAVIGAVDYMAPEQFDSREIDERTDVYAEGCMLFELLTGETPYKSDSIASLMRAKLDSEPRSLAEVGATVSPEMELVVANALARNPEERFGSPRELANAAVDALSVAAATRRMSGFALDQETRRMPIESTSATERKPASGDRSPMKPVLAGSLAVVLLIAAGVAVSRLGIGGDSPVAEPSKATTAVAKPPPEKSRGTSRQVSTAPVKVKETAAPSRPELVAGDDWPGGSAYTVVLASLASENQASDFAAEARSNGLDTGILFSSDYSSLNPGYWVVFSGTYQTSDGASERANYAQSLGYTDTYPRFVSR